MTEYVGLIGCPLSHSVSPVMQQAAFDHCRLKVLYELWETDPSGLGDAVERVRQRSTLGANVTVPYKETVVPLLDGLDGLASQIGAVNTLVNRDGRLLGYNTDAGGFLRALQEEAQFDPHDRGVVLLGAGGAARGVSFALARAGVGRLTIVNRTLERAETLAADLRSVGLEATTLGMQDGAARRAIINCDLLVNCTSIGMRHGADEGKSPVAASLIATRTLVCDVVYNPLETPLLRQARQASARTLGGLPMLVYQGALAFELWTGSQAPIDIMFEAAQRALYG